VVQAGKLLHGQETDVFVDADYQGIAKREEVKGVDVNWHIAMCPGKQRALNKDGVIGRLAHRPEQLKATIRAKVEIRSGSLNANGGITEPVTVD